MKTTKVLRAAWLAGVACALLGRIGAADRPDRKEEEKKLLAVLSSDAPIFEKAKACQELAVFGTAEAVPVLAALLAEEKLSHYARFALEPIPDPSVDTALREAAFGPGAGKLRPALLVGIVNSIGARRDAGSEGGLIGLLGAADPEVAAAAAAALGRLATLPAAEALRKAVATAPPPLRSEAAAACLACAEALAARGERSEAVALYEAVRRSEAAGHLRLAATRGAIVVRGDGGLPVLIEELESGDPARFALALQVSRELKGPTVTAGLVERLEKLPPDRQALAIGALADRSDPKALPAVLGRLKSAAPEVREAAVRALERLGDASSVPALLEIAAGPDREAAEAAAATLASLKAAGVDEAIVRLLDGSEPRLRPLVLRLAGKRRIAAAIPALRRAARAEGAEVRVAALEALGLSAGIEDLEVLVEAVLRPAVPEERGAAQESLRAACRRMPDRDATTERLVGAMSRAPVEGKALLLEVLSAVAGAKALEVALETAKSPEKPIREAAFRALGDWPNEEAAPKLLALLRSSAEGETRLAALRALSSVVRRLSFSSREERLGVSREAAELAKDAAERRIVIEALSGIPAPESLAMLRGWLADAELAEDACKAMVTISERLVRARAAAVVEPMEEVRRTTKDPDLAARAERVLAQAKGAMR